MTLDRRIFLITAAGAAGVFGTSVRAQAMVDEKDAQAAALGYVADAAKVDAKRFPKYAAGQNCANCALYQAKAAGDKAGGCSLFAGKQVAAAGWCSAWVKKAG
jgi:High potential iron-sulfur protein